MAFHVKSVEGGIASPKGHFAPNRLRVVSLLTHLQKLFHPHDRKSQEACCVYTIRTEGASVSDLERIL